MLFVYFIRQKRTKEKKNRNCDRLMSVFEIMKRENPERLFGLYFGVSGEVLYTPITGNDFTTQSQKC